MTFDRLPEVETAEIKNTSKFVFMNQVEMNMMATQCDKESQFRFKLRILYSCVGHKTQNDLENNTAGSGRSIKIVENT